MWEAANQLGVVAGTPGELLTALLSAPRRPRHVTLPADAPDAAALAGDLRALGDVHVTFARPPDAPPVAPATALDLSDPALVCAADPVRVTGAYEEGGEHGGLRAAWFRAGQVLVRAGQTPEARALALLAALPEDAEPRLRPGLAELAAGTPWEVIATRAGHASALAVCDGRFMVEEDPKVRALACPGDGTRLHLDERGHLHVRDGSPSRLARAVAATLATHPATALAALGDMVVTGDRMGSVHAFSLAGVHQAAPHSGRVTALAAAPGPRCYSGGVDGTVRTWRPGGTPSGTPLTRRPYPVVALHAGAGVLAVAWADGLAELHQLGTGESRAFRPGPAVRAVAVGPDGTLAVATPESLVHLRPR